MKVGILTYHRAENYGALLQAYALMTYLKQLGYDVSFVDYWPQYHSDYFKILSRQKIKKLSIGGKIHFILKLILLGRKKYNRKKAFKKFINEQLLITGRPLYKNEFNICDGYDCVIYGSDQIWRKQNMPMHEGFDYWYYASDNVNCKLKIAYAASMGSITLNDADVTILRRYFSKFNRLSVRESSLLMFLEDNGFNTQLVLDPVFLLDQKEWKELSFSKKTHKQKPKGKYILFYNLLRSSESVSFVNSLSDDVGLPIVEVTGIYSYHERSSRYIFDATVEQFLNLIEDASYVVSNSFHGVAFSIIFEKIFFAVGLKDKGERIDSLLSVVGIRERHFFEYNKNILSITIPYDNVITLLKSNIEKSKQFLYESLSVK